MDKTALVLLAEGFEEIEAVTPVDVLRRAGVKVTLAGVGAMLTTGARGVAYTADTWLGEVTGEFDMVVIPGGMPGAKNIGESGAARAIVEKTLARGGLVAAICAAPVLTLGSWGLLDGRRATCYPGMEEMFSPKVEFSSDRVVVDGPITTSRGPGTALEFSLALAAQLAGEEKAQKVAKAMLLR